MADKDEVQKLLERTRAQREKLNKHLTGVGREIAILCPNFKFSMDRFLTVMDFYAFRGESSFDSKPVEG